MPPPTSLPNNHLFWLDLDAKFRVPLYAYFLRRVKNRAEAEDLTQEAFTRLARHPDKPHGTGAQAYIFTVAANLLTDRARARATRKADEHQTLGALYERDEPRQLIDERTPERVLMAREALQNVMLALNELNERTRDIFVLSRLERMSYREISALYGISVSAVEKHIVKALAYLGARLLHP